MDVFEQAWKEYGDVAANLIEQYAPAFRKIVRRHAFNQTMFEDLYQDVVVWRTPRFIELWDPTLNVDMMTYIFQNVDAYCRKWKMRKKKLDSRVGYNSYVQSHETVQLNDAELMLQELDPYDEYLIRHYVIEGFTYDEIAEAAGTTRAAVRNRIVQILEEMREKL